MQMQVSDKSKCKNRIRIVLLFIVIVFGLIVFLNADALSRSPFDNQLILDEPECAAVNETGHIAYIDSLGNRVVVLTPEKKVSGIITYQSLSSVSPVFSTTLTMDRDRVYLLDHLMSENGTSIIEDRVLVYNFDGKYEKTLISTNELKTDENEYSINHLSVNDGRIYGTFFDDLDSSKIVVGDITEGSLSIIHCLDTTENDIYSISYQPEEDLTIAISYRGMITVWQGEKEVFVAEDDDFGLNCSNSSEFSAQKEALINCLNRVNGKWIGLDENNDIISVYENNQPVSVLAKTSAKTFNYCQETLVYADSTDYTLNVLNLTTKEIQTFHSLSYSESVNYRCYAIWIILAVGSLILLVLIVELVCKLIQKWKERRKLSEEHQGKKEEKVLTTARFYGPFFIGVIIIFGITAYILGQYEYHDSIKTGEATTVSSAYALSENSYGGFGNALSQINSEKDYGSQAYDDLLTCVDGICMTGIELEGRMNLECQIFRFIDGTDDIMVVYDPLKGNRIGTIYDSREQEQRAIDELIVSVRKGKLNEAHFTYYNASELYLVAAPLLDSSDNVIGMAIPFYNQTKVNADNLEKLFTRLLEVFTLLVGLAILLAELIYVRQIYGIKKKLRKENINNTTVIEADRSIGIFARIPGEICMLFTTVFAVTITKNAGIESAWTLALPITLQGIAYSVVRSFFGPIAKYDPKKYMFISIGVIVFGCILLIPALWLNHYVLFLISAVVQTIGSGGLFSSVSTICLSGKKPAPRYRLMVFSSLESAIAGAIGVSLSAVLRSFFGDIAVAVFIIVFTLLLVPLIIIFVGDDIAEEKRSGEKKKKERSIRKFRKSFRKTILFFIRPKMFVFSIVLLIPLLFLNSFQSYVLPLINSTSGYPDVLIGTITLVVKLISIFLVPQILKLVLHQKGKDIWWVVGGMGFIALLMAIFGMIPDMRMFTLVLIAITIFNAIFITVSIDVLIDESNIYGVNQHDMYSCSYVVSTGISYIQSFILTFMLQSGLNFFGYAWAIICCAVTVISFIILSLNQKKTEKIVLK